MSANLGTWMQSEIESQPGHLNAQWARYGEQLREILSGKSFDLVVLCARGSSDHAALYTRYLIEISLGIPVSLAAPSVLTRYGRALKLSNSLVIGISQSGTAPDIAEVLGSARSSGQTTLAITNSDGSRVERAADHHLCLSVGKEQSVAATKTFSASLVAGYELVRALGGHLPDPQLPTDAWVTECREWAETSAGLFLRSQPIFSIGRGYSFATASEAAIKLMECALLPCKAYSSADFQHGPKALAGAGSALVDWTSEVTLDQPVSILRPPSLPDGISEPCAPWWHIIAGQWLALQCSRSRGLDADKPQFIQKVTETL